METLALIEALDRDGHPRQILRVAQWPVRIGRAIDCDLVLDDPHVAALHATLDWRDDGLHVQPAATVNGVRLGASVIAPGSSPLLPPSGLLVLGATTLRVRLAGDVLAPVQRRVERGDMRIVQHEVAVDRAADAHRPPGDAQDLARVTVAVQRLDQGERFHANPCR